MRETHTNWRELYPFESHVLNVSGQQYHYLDEGQGRPLVMVHGNPTWSFYWRRLVVALRDSYRVVVPDHIGCGLSSKPQVYPYRLTSHIGNLVELIKELDLQDVTMLVHDWGGAIGLGAALRELDRLRSVVLFNTGAFPPPFVPFRIRTCRTPLLGTFAIRQLNLFARAAIVMAVERKESLSPAAAAGLLAPYDSWRNRVGIDRFVRDIPFTRRHPTWKKLTEIEAGLSSLKQPVQLIWGMRDWCFRPDCLQRFEMLFPHAEVHRFEDVGHYIVEEAHDRIVPLVSDFLRN